MILEPGATIGIVGGGQLGRMIALAAARLGFRCHVLTPEADAPAAQVTDRATIAPYDDLEAGRRFVEAVDVITIEFENLPVAPLEAMAGRRPVRPAPRVLAICQDRLREKAFLRDIEVPTTAFAPVASPAELRAALEIQGQSILKTTRLGYDGKGQVRLDAGSDRAAADTLLAAGPAILEQLVLFEREISVITARAPDGSIASYVPVENQHERGILARTSAPALIDRALTARAQALAEKIAAALDLVGLLAVEMFVLPGGRLLVNELAPRPHNSGHWTIDACPTSQFEQLVRVVCGLPLGDPTRLHDARMDNLIGDQIGRWHELLAEPGARLHLYGKREVRPGRKLGHVTRLLPKS